MADIYTKSGRPLKAAGRDLFARSGQQVARLRQDRAFGPDGRYVGTLVGDRLVYRRTHSARINSPFAPRRRARFAAMNRARAALWGEEPPIPD